MWFSSSGGGGGIVFRVYPMYSPWATTALLRRDASADAPRAQVASELILRMAFSEAIPDQLPRTFSTAPVSASATSLRVDSADDQTCSASVEPAGPGPDQTAS